MNLITDGLPALALATDPIDPDALRRPPRRPEAPLIDWAFGTHIALVGCLTAGGALSTFAYEWYAGSGLSRTRDAAFTVLVIAELLRAFGARSTTRTVWQSSLVANRPLVLIVLVSLALQVAIHDLAGLQVLFRTGPIAPSQWVAWLALGSVPLLVLEVWKVLGRHLGRYRSHER